MPLSVLRYGPPMRILVGLSLSLLGCAAKPVVTVPAPPVTQAQPPPAPKPPEAVPETFASDTPRTTVAGNAIVVPAGWSMVVKGPATILTPPETDSHIAVVDLQAKGSDDAVRLAWLAYDPAKKYEVRLVTPRPDREGWSDKHNYDYIVSPNEKRAVFAQSMYANGTWTVIVVDMDQGVIEKRGSQLGTIFSRFYPKGHDRESFAGKKANELDKARLAELQKFVETSQKLLGVPGVSYGIIQKGKTAFIGGFGVRELGTPAKVDGDTKYIVASNTKAMTTLMLARLVDGKKFTWDTTATSLLPSFKLGDADTTSKVLVKHLICACTGMPRQDMEWILEYGAMTPETALATLGTMQPTSKFGELFQYSNSMAAAAGYIGGHVAFPKLELGKAYDQAMQAQVFGPLGMTATTLDFKQAQTGNFAHAHAPDVDGKTAVALETVNTSVIPLRPAGGAWSSVRDMLKYVQMELSEGKLPDGTQFVSKDALLARRAPQVSINKDATYGMGLMVDRKYGVEVVHHGGDLIGFHSDMMWLPEQQVGAVVLTNGDPGWLIRSLFQRKLLEVLFDGKPEADAEIAAAAKSWYDSIAADRKLMTIPADPAEAGKLAPVYSNAALGRVAVSKAGSATVFDFGEWKSEVASRKNPDGTISFWTTAPGINDIELVAGTANGKRALILRDSQHEYVFSE